jgi:hypothetical protein
VSVWCACGGAFRNRQALSRHQRKSGCGGNNREDDAISPLDKLGLVGEDQVAIIGSMLKDLNILESGDKGRSLEDIVNEESKGLLSSTYSRFGRDGALESEQWR